MGSFRKFGLAEGSVVFEVLEGETTGGIGKLGRVGKGGKSK
ncbi:MAG: hypothetical protein NTU53_08265 [Planctomycetota bacterium]|nr:hypothetical protein [Planctomycetota bacterium]